MSAECDKCGEHILDCVCNEESPYCDNSNGIDKQDEINNISLFKRLAIANFMDSTTGICSICNHKFSDIDDIIRSDIIIVEKSEPIKIACRKCYGLR